MSVRFGKKTWSIRSAFGAHNQSCMTLLKVFWTHFHLICTVLLIFGIHLQVGIKLVVWFFLSSRSGVFSQACAHKKQLYIGHIVAICWNAETIQENWAEQMKKILESDLQCAWIISISCVHGGAAAVKQRCCQMKMTSKGHVLCRTCKDDLFLCQGFRR